MSLPLWVRGLRGLDRLAWFAYHTHEITRDELLFAWLSPELRSATTVAAYSQMLTYLPGGVTFEGGLFGWEQSLLDDEALPRRGRFLLAAAGGGRELKALLDRGYEVTAFEPNELLFHGACKVAAGVASAEVLRGSYQDLAASVAGQGPLAVLSGRHFDAVLLGWGSFTHVTECETRLSVLRSLRALAPKAPLVVSYFLRKPVAAASRTQQMRSVLRRLISSVSKVNAIEPGLGYDSGGGFVYSFTSAEIADLAVASGYRLELQRDEPFPHAIFVPVDA